MTFVPALKLNVQVGPQLMPAGELVTVPEPLTLTVNGCWTTLKVAVTFFVAVMPTTQPAVPLHAPLQPANVEPAAGDGVSVTFVP